MFQALTVVILAAIAVLILVRMVNAYIAKRQRPGQLAALAAQLGWRFETDADESFDDQYGHFSAFARGHSRSAFNTFYGAIEVEGRQWPVRTGDFRYRTTSTNGKHRTTVTHCLSYAIVETPHLGAPDLYFRREGLFDRVAGAFGFEDIDFESAEFSERFHVKSSDKRFAYAVLDPRMMEFLLDGDPPSFDFRRGQCCLLRGEKWWTAAELATTIRWAQQFFARWPRQIPSVLDA
jgi:hypothetical protein